MIVQDLRFRRIPNASCAVLFLFGILLALLQFGMKGLGSALLAAAAAFIVFLALHLTAGMGAGDVKLMAACGALVGTQDLLTAAVLTAMAGLVHACGALLRGRLNGRRVVSIPYAPAILSGTALVLIARLR